MRIANSWPSWSCARDIVEVALRDIVEVALHERDVLEEVVERVFGALRSCRSLPKPSRRRGWRRPRMVSRGHLESHPWSPTTKPRRLVAETWRLRRSRPSGAAMAVIR
jgi:hypothetical protein